MRYILFIAFFVLMTGAEEIPDDANTIVITTEQTPDEAFRSFGKLLLKEGFTLADIDKTFLMLTTELKTFGVGFLNGQKLEIKITAEILESPTRIKLICEFMDKSYWEAFESKPDFDEHGKRAKNSSGAYGEAFEILDKIALKYEDGELEYLIEDTD